MGVCVSVDLRKSQQIQRQLEVDFEKESSSMKLLLLGSGECGKSTILKQMRILHLNGFDKKQLLEYRKIIFNNIASTMCVILRAMDAFKIQLANRKLEAERNIVFESYKKFGFKLIFPDDLYKAVSKLWADPGVQQCFMRRSEYQLIDSAKYFMDALDRIHCNDYIPTTQDALMARAATSGVVEVVFPFKDTIFRMVDSAGLFKEVCNSEWFLNATIILFLNKKDLFEEKIKTTSIKYFFRDFNGPESFDACVGYIREFFLKLNYNPDKSIQAHVTCATDTNQVQVVINEVVNGLIEKNFGLSGMS